MITITKTAIKQLKDIAEDEGIEELCIRAKIVGGGCAGFQNDLYFDSPADIDEVIECNGIKIVIDLISFQYLDGANIDWVETEIAKGFKINNPNVNATCGCSNSFK